MFDRAAIVRPLGRCRVVERSKQSRQARGASGRSSIHTFSARAPSRRAVFSRFPHPLHAHVPSTNQENVRMVPCLAARRQQCATRRNSPHFFPRCWQSPYSSQVLAIQILLQSLHLLVAKSHLICYIDTPSGSGCLSSPSYTGRSRSGIPQPSLAAFLL